MKQLFKSATTEIIALRLVQVGRLDRDITTPAPHRNDEQGGNNGKRPDSYCKNVHHTNARVWRINSINYDRLIVGLWGIDAPAFALVYFYLIDGLNLHFPIVASDRLIRILGYPAIVSEPLF